MDLDPKTDGKWGVNDHYELNSFGLGHSYSRIAIQSPVKELNMVKRVEHYWNYTFV